MNKLSESTKFLLLSASLVITCALVALGFFFMHEAKDMSAVVIEDLDDFTIGLQYSDIKKYDGLTISGSDVINFTKKYLSDIEVGDTPPFQIDINTPSLNAVHIDRSKLMNLANFSTSYFVKATANFVSSVEINKNGVIIKVTFTQK